jgi:Coenzyme PQQ synthesis protein D (PqqD)
MTETRVGKERSGFLQRQNGVVLRRIADETLLVPTSGELAHLQRIFVLDTVGEFVWELMDGTRDLEAIVLAVAGEFDVSEIEAKIDLEEFVDALRQAGLVIEPGNSTESETHGAPTASHDR